MDIHESFESFGRYSHADKDSHIQADISNDYVSDEERNTHEYYNGNNENTKEILNDSDNDLFDVIIPDTSI